MAMGDSRSTPPDDGSNLRRGATVAAAALVVALGGAVLYAHLVITPAWLERRVNAVLGPASGGLYSVRIGGVRLALWRQALWLQDAALVARDGGGEPASFDLPATRFEVRVRELSISGVNLLKLLVTGDIEASSVSIRQPEIEARVRLQTAARDAEREPDAVSFDDWVAAALHGIPRLRIGTIAVESASVEASLTLPGPGTDTEKLQQHVGSADIRVHGLNIHEGAGVEGLRSLYSDEVEIELDDVSLELPGDTDVRIESLSGSMAQRRLSAQGLVFEPELTPADYFERTELSEPDRISVLVESLSVDGFRPWSFLQSFKLQVDELAVQGFRVDVLHDARKPPPPRLGAPAMPHDLIHRSREHVRIGRVVLHDGFISYSEWARGGQRPGTITFEQIDGTIAPMPPEDAGASAPVAIDLSTKVAAAADTRVHIGLAMAEPAPSMNVSVDVGPFEASALDTILPALEGLQLESGSVDGVVVRLRYEPGLAEGWLVARYRDLKLALQSKSTGKQSLGHKLVSWAANAFAVRHDNPAHPEQPPFQATIQYQIAPEAPFFKLLWEPIRDGLLLTVKK